MTCLHYGFRSSFHVLLSFGCALDGPAVVSAVPPSHFVAAALFRDLSLEPRPAAHTTCSGSLVTRAIMTKAHECFGENESRIRSQGRVTSETGSSSSTYSVLAPPIAPESSFKATCLLGLLRLRPRLFIGLGCDRNPEFNHSLPNFLLSGSCDLHVVSCAVTVVCSERPARIVAKCNNVRWALVVPIDMHSRRCSCD